MQSLLARSGLRFATGAAIAGISSFGIAFAQGKDENTSPQVCPINHSSPMPQVCPVNHATSSQQPKVCPIVHSSTTPQDLTPLPDSVFKSNDPTEGLVCPVKHSTSTQSTSSTTVTSQEEAPKVCPVNHGVAASSTTTEGVCPIDHTASDASTPGSESTTAPAPQPKRRVCPMAKKPGMMMLDDDDDNIASEDDDSLYHPSDPAENHLQYPDFKIGGYIPATGRGNSEDGAHWVSPTTREMFRALRRKDKEINELDAFDVAATHGDVVDSTWHLIMEYEQLHVDKCKDITLKRFEGMYGIPTFKSRLGKVLNYGPPFDRHDWYIDRCGTEVRYIIDYYSMDGDFNHDYSIDVRPDLQRLENIYDRIRLAYKRYKNDEPFW